jgi:hypothetical protein
MNLLENAILDTDGNQDTFNWRGGVGTVIAEGFFGGGDLTLEAQWNGGEWHTLDTFAASADAAYDTLVATTIGDGTYDDTTYPILLGEGAIDQGVTLLFTSATEFGATSDVAGVVLTDGVTTEDYAPLDPDGKPYFTIDKDGWTGTWADTDDLDFNTTAEVGGGEIASFTLVAGFKLRGGLSGATTPNVTLKAIHPVHSKT